MTIFVKQNIKKIIGISMCVAITIISIMMYLSFHGKHFDWLYLIKNSTNEKSLFPILSIIVGSIGTITAGNVMQYTTKNNLASPFTMGILPAASLAAVTLRLANIASLWATLGLGILYAVIILSIVIFSSWKAGKNNMIVVGLAIGMVVMGLNYLLSTKLPSNGIVFRWFSDRNIYFTAERFTIFTPMILIASTVLILLSKYTTYYRRDPIKSLTLGINIKLLTYINYLFVVIVSVSTVMLIGEIAFIGMAIPNITRLLFKSDKMWINILIGVIITIPLLMFTMIIANANLINFQLLVSVVCAPVFIIAIIIRRVYEK